MDKEIKVFDGTVMPEKREQPQQNMMQIRGDHVAAMIVPKPRSIEKTESMVMKEAVSAKNDFYWGWFVKNKRTGKKEWIEGGTIGLAQALYRAWTNCELKTEVREENGQWIFKSTIIDFENGETMTREHRVLKPIVKSDSYDYDRTIDMKFQAWYSRNQRNTIFAMLPRWLRNKAIEAAKTASQNELKGSHKEKFEKAIKYFLSRNISEQEIFSYFDKESVDEFGVEDVARVCNIANQLYNGEISPDEIKKQSQEDFEEKAKQRKREEKKQETKKEQPKVDSSKKEPPTKTVPAKEEKPKEQKKESAVSELPIILKSFDTRGISETEICAYFYSESVNEIAIDDLKQVVTELEAEKITPEQFKKDAAERWEIAVEEKKGKEKK